MYKSDIEILTWVKKQLYENIPLEQKMYDMLDALAKGFSMSTITLEPVRITTSASVDVEVRTKLKDIVLYPAWAWIFFSAFQHLFQESSDRLRSFQ